MKTFIFHYFMYFSLLFSFINPGQSQSIIEIGATTYLNKSNTFELFNDFEDMNTYYLGVAPAFKYSYLTETSFEYGAAVSIYRMGTYFDISSSPMFPLRNNIKPVHLIKEQVIDLSVLGGYHTHITEKLQLFSTLSLHYITPTFNSEGYLEEPETGVVGSSTIVYLISGYGNLSPSFGYGFQFGLRYFLLDRFHCNIGLQFQDSFTTLAKYYVAHDGISDPDQEIVEYSSFNILSNDNSRYGINLSLGYAF